MCLVAGRHLRLKESSVLIGESQFLSVVPGINLVLGSQNFQAQGVSLKMSWSSRNASLGFLHGSELCRSGLFASNFGLS